MAQSPTHATARRSHATGTTSGGWTPRNVAVCALFTALALVLSFVELPIFPIAPWLKYDPSGAIGLVAGLAFGPGIGAVVAVLPWIVHLFVEPFGAIMALFCSVVTVVPAALIYRARPTGKGLAIALVVSGVLALIAAILGNLVITPLYSHMPIEGVVELIIPILIPFNLLKICINAVLAALALVPVSVIVKRWD